MLILDYLEATNREIMCNQLSCGVDNSKPHVPVLVDYMAAWAHTDSLI